MVGDRILDQVAVDFGVGVQRFDHVVELLGVGVAVDVHVSTVDTDLLAVALFHVHVRLARGIVSHQHGGESRPRARVGERLDRPRELVAKFTRDCVPVDDLRHHSSRGERA